MWVYCPTFGFAQKIKSYCPGRKPVRSESGFGQCRFSVGTNLINCFAGTARIQNFFYRHKPPQAKLWPPKLFLLILY